jgi:uncharacterized membrane protein YraQ (UPF0718 family)
VALKKQGANNGATTAFLISTPESGIDSMAVTYALLDPVMTVARPLVAFVTAACAGVMENLFSPGNDQGSIPPDLTCPVDGCCDGEDCPPEEHQRHHGLWEKIVAGLRYALTELWSDLAGWFFVGLIAAGLIMSIVPDDVIIRYSAGGLSSMLVMLGLGIPLYICATASTPIAAALILKGASPGAALVFLLAGPATNVTSITVLLGILGKRATTVYLTTIGLSAMFFGLALDRIYHAFGLSAQAMAGQASEIVPMWAQWTGAMLLLLLSVKPVSRSITIRIRRMRGDHRRGTDIAPSCASPTCDCSSGPVRSESE